MRYRANRALVRGILGAVVCLGAVLSPASWAADPVKPAPKAPAPKAPAPARGVTVDDRINRPPAQAIDAMLLDRAVRASLAGGVKYLMDLMAANDDGLVVPPRQTRGMKEIDVHYSRKMVTIPDYQNVYEEREVPVIVRQGTQDVLTRVTKQFLVRQIKIGEHQEEREVHDDKGPIVHKEVHQVGEMGGGPEEFTGVFFGQNAMGLYALRVAGMPSDDPAVIKLADKLEGLLNLWSLPDQTTDLAWLLAAYAQMPEKRFNGLRDRLAGKLLGGQIDEGPGKGMWGPVSIDFDLLKALMDHEKLVSAEDARLKALLAKDAKNKDAPKLLEKVEVYKDTLPTRYLDVTRDATRFAEMAYRTFSRKDDVAKAAVTYEGLPYNVYIQEVGDLQTTALVLWALQQTAEHHRLPDKTPTIKSFQNADLTRPRATLELLQRSAAALAPKQRPEGGWDEMNTLRPVTAFNNMDLPGLQHKVPLPPSLPSPVTLCSLAHGYQAMVNVALLLGPDKGLTAYAKPLARGEDKALEALNDLLSSDPAKRDPAAMPIGCDLGVFNFAGALIGVQRRLGTDEEAHRAEWSRLAYYLVGQQRLVGQQLDPAGGWGPKTRPQYLSTGLRARGDAIFPAEHELVQSGIPDPKKRAPYNRARAFDNYYPPRYFATETSVIATALAMGYLADAARPPLLALWTEGKDLPSSGLAEAALRIVGKPQAMDLSCARAAPDFAALTPRLPVLLLEGSAAIDPPSEAALQKLGAYVSGGGLIVAVSPAGAAFTDSVVQQVLKNLPGVKEEALPEDAPLLRDMVLSNEQRAGLKTFVREGKPAAVLFSYSRGKAAAGAWGAAEAAQLLATALRLRTPEQVLLSQYPCTADGEGDLSARRKEALGDLKAMALSILNNFEAPKN